MQVHKGLTGMDETIDFLHESDPAACVKSVEIADLHGLAAMVLLHHFLCTGRCVDNLTCARKPHSQRLLYGFVLGKPVSEY